MIDFFPLYIKSKNQIIICIQSKVGNNNIIISHNFSFCKFHPRQRQSEEEEYRDDFEDEEQEEDEAEEEGQEEEKEESSVNSFHNENSDQSSQT